MPHPRDIAPLHPIEPAQAWALAEDELARVWTKVEAIRAKQAAKPKHSIARSKTGDQPSRVAVGVPSVRCLCGTPSPLPVRP